MELHDPYRAPATIPAPPALPRALPEVRAQSQADSDAAEYYSPSTLKMVLLSPTTFGLYPLYWFWRNWQAIKRETGGSQWTWARALFSPIWAYFCFSDLRSAACNRRRDLAFDPALLAVAYFLLNLSTRLPNVGWLLGLFIFVPLLPVNSLLRRYHQDERVDMERMDRFNIWHILVVVAGGLFLLLLFIAMAVTPDR
ncbi:hypothetical protein [Stenotrophomonas sp. AB1(2024)]|uniref:hypothetical protein n=1 Tax=Stenotrophomonas sp. AB1(2024) TaxID=3132215 RepID=UPI0030A4F130